MVKEDWIFEVVARFGTTGYLSDVFISKSEEVVVHVFHDSETSTRTSFYSVKKLTKEMQYIAINSYHWITDSLTDWRSCLKNHFWSNFSSRMKKRKFLSTCMVGHPYKMVCCCYSSNSTLFCTQPGPIHYQVIQIQCQLFWYFSIWPSY